MLSVGVDFGTTNSSVAVYDGKRLRLLDIDPAGTDPRVMRSLVYFQRTGGIYFGRQALEAYLEQNTGRAVRYEMRRVGEIQMTFAEIGTLVKDAFALIDVNEPGRLFQSLKRFLAVSYFKATNVYGRDYSVEELLSLIAGRILEATKRILGAQIDKLTVGWPVRFSADERSDRLARERAREAWRLAGAGTVRFVQEPVAAIQHFVHETESRSAENALVFDFGGGTLDICAGSVRGSRVEVLATSGVPIGGDLLDSRLVETKLAPLFGEQARYKRTGLPLPRHLFNRLRSWQTLVELSKPESFELILRAKHESDQPEQLARLETMVAKNYGLAFFQAVEQAKVTLSSRQEAEVSLANDNIEVHDTVARADFEAAVSPQIMGARECVEECLQRAGLDAQEIDIVLTTGGSSQIPAFRRMLAEALPCARLQDADAFTSVAAGLALSGFEH